MTEIVSDRPASLSDIEKSAVVMVSIGQDAAAQVVKLLSPPEINLLAGAMIRVSGIAKEGVAAAFREFAELMGQENPFGVGAEDYVSGVLEKALGPDKAARLVGRLKQGDYASGIDSVQWQDPQALADIVKAEHPQVVATIFAYLEPEQAQLLIQHLPDELVDQVIPRLAVLDTIPPAAIRALNESLEHLLAGGARLGAVAVHGVDMSAKLLTRIGTARAQRVLEALSEIDPGLAKTLTDSMFVFEDLLELDDRNLQILLRAVDQNLLVSALKGASQAMQNKVLRNLSQRAGEMLREEIEARGPMRLSEVEAAKKEILAAATALEREGKIVLRTDPGEVVT
ncbi:MAG TPA: flagellar motor switch protein FliG [Stellaceae bacterium]|nr:flagellar motor switch protein FliG [Stellaceae bacterium]